MKRRERERPVLKFPSVLSVWCGLRRYMYYSEEFETLPICSRKYRSTPHTRPGKNDSVALCFLMVKCVLKEEEVYKDKTFSNGSEKNYTRTTLDSRVDTYPIWG